MSRIQTTILSYVDTEEVQDSIADVLCWFQGFEAAFANSDDKPNIPVGVDALRETSLRLQRDMRRVVADEKKAADEAVAAARQATLWDRPQWSPAQLAGISQRSAAVAEARRAQAENVMNQTHRAILDELDLAPAKPPKKMKHRRKVHRGLPADFGQRPAPDPDSATVTFHYKHKEAAE